MYSFLYAHYYEIIRCGLIWIGKNTWTIPCLKVFYGLSSFVWRREKKTNLHHLQRERKSSVLMQMLTGLFTLCESPEILQGKIGLQFFDMRY